MDTRSPIVTYSYARQNLAKLMDEVERDGAPVFISRQRKRGAAVLVSESEWSSIQETLYLLSSPENARRLRKGIADLNAGKGIVYDPATPDIPPRPLKPARKARKK
jgi:antitoxin YefM